MMTARSAARRLTFILGSTLVLTTLSMPVHASRVRPMNLEEMVERAGYIISGRCTGVRVIEDVDLGMPVTELTFEIRRTLKGPARKTLTIRQPGAPAQPGQRSRGPLGLPEYEAGEEVLLLLYGESRAGLTSPVGLGQGKFTIITDKNGQRWAVNRFGSLARGRSEEGPGRSGKAMQGRGLSEEELLQKIQTLMNARPERADGKP